MKEEWRPIKESCGGYEVSNLGSVRSLTRNIFDGRWGYRIFIGKNIQGSFTMSGYPQVSMRVNGKAITRPRHRLVAIAFLDNPNNLPTVNHKDGNKLNNSVENLEWCSWEDNHAHAVKMGLCDSRGEKCGMSKLKEYQVREIHKKYLEGKLRQIDLAKEYNISREVIESILKGRTWKHLNLLVTEDMRKNAEHRRRVTKIKP